MTFHYKGCSDSCHCLNLMSNRVLEHEKEAFFDFTTVLYCIIFWRMSADLTWMGFRGTMQE